MIMTSPAISRQRETANEVIAAFNAWDIDRIIGFRSEDCTYEVLPKSLGSFFKINLLDFVAILSIFHISLASSIYQIEVDSTLFPDRANL